MTRSELNEMLWLHQRDLTKPIRSLGKVEELAVQLGMIQQTRHPVAAPAAATLFAADHPVAALAPGVSAYPQSVTAAMVANFENGGAAACVLARQHGIRLRVVDAGVGETPGTGDLRAGEALTEAAFREAVMLGEEAVGEEAIQIFGEMGIGNTTAAAAVTGALLDLTSEQVTGTGTGVADLEPKYRAVDEAIQAADRSTPETVLRSVGGREIAALYGAIRRAVGRGQAVLIDGYIVSAAALAVCQAEPTARQSLIFSHRSREGGQHFILESLMASPLLDLDLALGEASGALLAYPLLVSACELHNEMATFDSAGVSRANKS